MLRRTDCGSLRSRMRRPAPASPGAAWTEPSFPARCRLGNVWEWPGKSPRGNSTPGVSARTESSKWMRLKLRSEVWPWLSAIWENLGNISSLKIHVVLCCIHIHHVYVCALSIYISGEICLHYKICTINFHTIKILFYAHLLIFRVNLLPVNN